MWKHNKEKVREVTQTGNEKSNDADDYLRELLLEFFIGVVDTELFKTVLLKSFKPGKKKHILTKWEEEILKRVNLSVLYNMYMPQLWTTCILQVEPIATLYAMYNVWPSFFV